MPDRAAVRRLSACFDGHLRLRRDHHRHAGPDLEARRSAARGRLAACRATWSPTTRPTRPASAAPGWRSAGARRVPRARATTGGPLPARTSPAAGSPSRPGSPTGRSPHGSSPRTPPAIRSSPSGPSSSTGPRRPPSLERAKRQARSSSRSPTHRPVSPAPRSRSGTSRPSPTGHSAPRSRTAGSPPGSTAAAPRASTCASRSATRRATSPRAPPPVSTTTSAKFGRRVRKVRSGRVKVPFGRSARLRGRLTRSASQALAGQTIVATATVRRRGAPTQPAGSAVTDRRGRFSLRVPAGPSRNYRLAFNGGGGALGAARSVSVRVPASSTIRASRTRVSGRTRVRFSGRLRSRGQPIPGRGLVLVLQGRERGTLAHVRGHPDERRRAAGARATPSAADRGAIRSGSASGASRATRSSSATRER